MWEHDVNDRLSGWWLTAGLVFLLSLVSALLATHVSHNLPALTRVSASVMR